MNHTDAEFIASKKILCHYEHSPKHFILKDEKGFIYSGKSYCEKHYDMMKETEGRKTIVKRNFTKQPLMLVESEKPEILPVYKEKKEYISINIFFKMKISHIFEKDSNMEFIQKAINDLRDAVGKENIHIEYKVGE